MITTMVLTTLIIGIGSYGLWSPMGSTTTPSDMEQSFGSKKKPQLQLPLERGDAVMDNPLRFHRFFVQRQSSSPPGESHRGRASASQAGTIPESNRDSGRALDQSENQLNLESGSASQHRAEETVTTPKRRADSLERERQSQPASRRRGGIVK